MRVAGATTLIASIINRLIAIVTIQIDLSFAQSRQDLLFSLTSRARYAIIEEKLS